ncbi:MAG: hypothetical protein AUH85_16900 [Chloroflexi bacterium 13_1_40CM_4_68_4]|nr:MAG: hypothetical protein AUH85_16900 [Chloroflexi bacterium 13_1_40CM_4_68_4]
MDDDREICEIITAALALEGFTVKTAFDATRGLELADDDTALVLLDVRLPGLEPVEFVRRYRERKGRAAAPIVVFSASSQIAEFARSVDADGILCKPFELQDLIDLVRRHLDTPGAPSSQPVQPSSHSFFP